MDEATIRQQVFQYLKEHPFQNRVNHKKLAKDLGLDYEYYKQYLWQLAKEYKTDYSKQQGLKGLNWHNWRGYIYLKSLFCNPDGSRNPKRMEVVRRKAINAGWIETKARNRYLLFKDRNGRLEWYMTGRVKVWIRKPVTKGKQIELLANGFAKTDLISDPNWFIEWIKGLRMKGVHVAIDTGFELPYLKFDLFKGSNGTILLLGDKSHKRCAELQMNYPDWAEKNEALFQQVTKQFEQFTGFLQSLVNPPTGKDVRGKVEHDFIV